MHLHFEATVRELDGLAMSSRNLRLTEQQRKLSTAIYQELSQIRSQLNDRSIMELKETAAQHLKEKGFMVDYVEIAQAEDLKPAVSTDQPLVALAAASIGDIRLIDNLILN
jgi:pantoate--beta-alanine ligase